VRRVVILIEPRANLAARFRAARYDVLGARKERRASREQISTSQPCGYAG
jgi:hypothetical protein